MKNLKRLLGLMAISGFAFGFAATVNAAALDPTKTCGSSVAYVQDDYGVHCFSSLAQAMKGVKTDKEQNGITTVESNEIVLLKNAAWKNTAANKYSALDFQVTINLNGHNIVLDADSEMGFDVLTNGNLTIVGTGKIDASKVTAAKFTTGDALVTVAKNGAFATMGDVTIDATSTDLAKPVFVVDGGSLGISEKTTVNAGSKISEAVQVKGADSLVALNGTWSGFTASTNPTVNIVAGADGSQVEVAGTWKALPGVAVKVAADDIELSLNAKIDSASEVVLVDGTIASGSVTVLDGSYTSNSQSGIYVQNGTVAVDIQKGDITSKTRNAVAVAGGSLVVGKDAGKLTAGSTKAALYVGADVESVTINGGTFKVEGNGNNSYALWFIGSDTKYAINGGTFESAKAADNKTQLPAIHFASLTDEFVDAHKGMLTGGRYLTSIIADEVLVGSSTYMSSENLLAKLVKEGYQVTEDGNYKVITPVAGSTHTLKSESK